MPKASAVAAAAKRAGFDLIEASSLESMRREATEGLQLKVAVERREVENKVEAAIARGKITPRVANIGWH
jgi:hypothetical protein